LHLASELRHSACKAANPNCLEPVTSEIRLEIGLNNYSSAVR
jgi:hypothetical protein